MSFQNATPPGSVWAGFPFQPHFDCSAGDPDLLVRWYVGDPASLSIIPGVAFHTLDVDRVPPARAGHEPRPGPMKVADGKLRAVLGINNVRFVQASNGSRSSTSHCKADAES